MTWTYDDSYQLPRKQRAGATSYDTKFVYDGQHIAMVFDGDDTLTHRYMYGPGIDMILADEAFDGATGNFLDLYWMLGDHQGSVTSVLSHNSGQTSVVQQLAYTAFGSIGSIKDGQGNNVTTGPISRFAYTGREFDPETGDYHYRARYYDPQFGRFLSQDPIGFAAGDMNLYRYVGNSSPNWVDPSGLRADERMTSGPSSPIGHAGPVRYNDGSGPHPMMPPGPVAPPGRSGPILDGASPMGMLPIDPNPSPFDDIGLESLLMDTNGSSTIASLLLPALLAAIDPLAEDSIDRGFWEMIRRHDFDTARLILERYKGMCKDEARRRVLEKGLNDYLRHHDKFYKQMMNKSLGERRDWVKGYEIAIRRHMEKRAGCDTTETIRMKIMQEIIRGSLQKRPKF